MFTTIVRFTAPIIPISVTSIASPDDALVAPAGTVLSSFSAVANAYARLLMDKAEALYGTTTTRGRAPNEGTLFEVTPLTLGHSV